MDQTVLTILKKGVEEANLGHKIQARAFFFEILTIDPNNEYALLWQAYLSDDPYKAVGFLERLLKVKPRHKTARAYLKQARQRCDEFEKRCQSQAVNDLFTTYNIAGRHGLPVPYLGDYLVHQDLITPQQLEMALKLHANFKERGHPKPIGQVLVELGYITNEQLNRWLQKQNEDLETFYLRNLA